ncbi:glutathione S-transferase, partial [Tremellales sp. Uapishka_1]
MAANLVLRGHPRSPRTQVVLVSLLQMGLVADKDFQLETVDVQILKTPEWIARHPFGQVPVLEDTTNQFEIYESRAIAKYAAAKFGSPLAPNPAADVRAYGQFEQACSVEASDFTPPIRALAFELYFKKARSGQPADETQVQVQEELFHTALEAYERILAKHAYVAGDQLTLADLFHLPFATLVLEAGHAEALVDGSLPNVARWWKAISSLEAWATVVAGSKT